MTKGVLFDLHAIARPASPDLAPLLEELRNLGHEVYGPEFQAAHAFVLHLDVPRRRYEGAEKMLEAVFRHLDLKPKRTEIMSLAPVFAELHRVVLHEDAARSLPALAAGRRVGVVSHLPSGFVKPVLDALGAPVTLVTPADAKAAPPNPKAIRAGVSAMKLRAKDVAYVSPSCDDLGVARGLGLVTAFLPRPGGACTHALLTIRTLDELDGALKSLAKPEGTGKPAPGSAPASSGTR